MRLRHIAIAVALATTAVIGLPTTADAVTGTQIYAGTGWKANTNRSIHSIDPNRQYTITFSSTTTKNLTSKYLTRAIPQLQAAGVKINIGGVETVAEGTCPPRGHIWIQRKYRPLNGKPGYSRALPCHDTTNNSAWGGVVQMDSEYYDGRWKMSTAGMWNAHVHEVLHVMGLNHPNYDKDRDGRVEDYECVATSYGNRPIMCSPSGGYKTSTSMGKLVGFDVNGIKQLLANYTLPAPTV